MDNKKQIDNIYEDFSGYQKTGEIYVELGQVKRLAFLGMGVAIEYEVQKQSDRKTHVYRHEFESPCIVASNGKEIIIIGDKITVTEKGIEG